MRFTALGIVLDIRGPWPLRCREVAQHLSLMLERPSQPFASVYMADECAKNHQMSYPALRHGVYAELRLEFAEFAPALR